MRFPLTETQAFILVKLINKEKLLKRDMMILDMVILTQVGAIKMRKEGLTITKAGKIRFVKWARKEGIVA
jgi:hypothetical protein